MKREELLQQQLYELNQELNALRRSVRQIQAQLGNHGHLVNSAAFWLHCLDQEEDKVYTRVRLVKNSLQVLEKGEEQR